MCMSDIEKMVASSKQTTYMGKLAWTVPNGKCTTDFWFACRCWEQFLNGNTNNNEWLSKAIMRSRL